MIHSIGSKDYEDGVAHDHDFEFVQADQLDYILYNQGNGFEELQRALQTSMATQPDLSWGSRGPGTALEELCRMTNDGLESLPDIQPFIVPIPGKTCIFVFICISTIFSLRALHFSRGRIHPVHMKLLWLVHSRQP